MDLRGICVPYELTEYSDCGELVEKTLTNNWLTMFQIAHPLVKNQLIKYIYDGFLVPVLGPALHQVGRHVCEMRPLPSIIT